MTEKELRFKKKLMTDGRRTGLLLVLIGIGLPLILSFFQIDGVFRFFGSSMAAERTLTPQEIKEIKVAVDTKKNRLDEMQRAVEYVKEKYRKQLGEDYYKDVWFVREYHGFLVPFKYVIALGILFVFVGTGKFITG